MLAHIAALPEGTLGGVLASGTCRAMGRPGSLHRSAAGRLYKRLGPEPTDAGGGWWVDLQAEVELGELVKRGAKRAQEQLLDEAPLGWEELLQRVFGVDRWEWSSATPTYGHKPLRLRTVVEGAPAVLIIARSR